MTKKLFLIPGIVVLALLLAFPPLRRAGDWEPGGSNHRFDRFLFGYGIYHDWIGMVGTKGKLTNRTGVTMAAPEPKRMCETYHLTIDWLWLVPEIAVGLSFFALALLPKSRAPAPNPPKE